jgi:Malectin domain/Fibronectin type III domain
MLNRRLNQGKLLYFAYTLLIVLCLSSLAHATTYYVDCNAGSDTNAGTSAAAAWKSLTPVNAKVFAPGDSLLMIMGCTWTGTLHPGGSGTNGNTITINEYGSASTMPHIEGGGATEAVLLSGQEYWDVNNLEVSNNASASGARRGVRVIATGVSNHIHLIGLNVHNVVGELGTDATSKNTGGIGIESTGGAGASFDDLLIQNCTINDTDDMGIYLDADSGTAPRSSNWAQAKWNNVVIEGNQISDIGKNAVVVRSSDTPIIQNNVINGSSTRLHGNAIYTIGTLNAVIQLNEIYNTALTGYSGLEDAAIDPDNDSNGTLIQYNYSHNNAGGMANPNMIPGAGNYCDGTIIRYNISQDDTNQVVQFSGAATNTQIYNNTIYVGSGLSPIIFGAHLWGGTGGWANNTTYSNNIIYNVGTGTYDLGGSTNNVFDANLFYGNHESSEPSDPKKLTSNPLLQNPGSGGTGINTLDGYQLDSGSPAISSGVVINNNGGRDFFGTTLPTSAPDRGAAQSAPVTCAVPSAPSGLTATAISTSQINLGWSAAQASCPITYSVFQSTTSGFTPSTSNQIASGLTSTTYSNTGLAASTTYYYLVEAVDSTGPSAASNQASATTNAASTMCSSICIDSGSKTPVSPFVADEDFTGGATIDHANTINLTKVTDPAPEAVYQSARDGATQASGVGAPFTYTIPGFTAASSHTIRLHFAETFFTAKGKRVFNVSINGTQVLTNFDIFAAAGGENIANIQQFTVPANASGQYVITFTSVTNNALVSGIEID